MTAAVYNQNGGWGIPPYIWPAVLGISAAFHVAVLIYGLPELSWPSQDETNSTETEILFESGGLEFDTVATIERPAKELTVPELTPIVSQVTTQTPLEAQSTAVPARPTASEPIRPAQSSADEPTVIQPTATESVSSSVVAGAVETNTVQTVPQPETITATAIPVEPTENTVVATVPVIAVDTAPVQNSSESVSVPSSATVIVSVSPSANAITAIQDIGQVVVANSDVSVSTQPQISAPLVQAPASVSAQVPTPVAPSTTPIQPVSGGGSSTAIAPVAAVTAPAAVQSLAASQDTSSTRPVSSTAVAVASKSTNAAVVQPPSSQVQSVSPLEQKIASVAPTEVDLPTLSPSEPETSDVPVAPLSGEPAHNVSPVEVASIDPLAKVTDYVSNYDAGDCAHLTVMDAGTQSAAVTAFGAGIAPFVEFDKTFAADQGYEAKIEVRLITRQQCALLNALGLSSGVEAAGLVDLDQTLVRSGTSVSGVIQRDLPLERITAAEELGLELNGKGPPELYVIDDAGQIHDGRSRILPAPNPFTAGGWRFSVPVTLISADNEETALILAVWNRPKHNQPPRFGTLPASGIADVLADPGVYSLTAFKVSR